MARKWCASVCRLHHCPRLHGTYQAILCKSFDLLGCHKAAEQSTPAACAQVSEDAADPELREVAGQAHASLLRVKGHASAGDLLGAAVDEAVSAARLLLLLCEVSMLWLISIILLICTLLFICNLQRQDLLLSRQI